MTEGELKKRIKQLRGLEVDPYEKPWYFESLEDADFVDVDELNSLVDEAKSSVNTVKEEFSSSEQTIDEEEPSGYEVMQEEPLEVYSEPMESYQSPFMQYEGIMVQDTDSMDMLQDEAVKTTDIDEIIELLELEEEEKPDYFEIVKDFDLGTAVVYSAILNRQDY